MNRAQRRAVELRRRLGLCGRVDSLAVADILGLEVTQRPLRKLRELKIGEFVCIARRLEPEWKRWCVAHAIGHMLMHPGNHVWTRRHTGLAHKYEREAEDFAHALLLDVHEVVQRGLTHSWQVADYFGVPEEVLSLQVPLKLD